MKLYHSPKAVNPERTFNFLKAKGKLDAVELVEVSIMKGEHKSAEYRVISPFAQVPALVLDDGTNITESRAICTYFENLFPEPNLMGTDAKDKALIEMWDRRIEMQMMAPFAQWFRNAHPMMAPLENPQLPDAAAKSETIVKKFAKRLDDHLQGRNWLAVDRFTIADITLYLTCGFCGVMQWKPHREHDNIGRVYAAIKERLA